MARHPYAHHLNHVYWLRSDCSPHLTLQSLTKPWRVLLPQQVNRMLAKVIWISSLLTSTGIFQEILILPPSPQWCKQLWGDWGRDCQTFDGASVRHRDSSSTFQASTQSTPLTVVPAGDSLPHVSAQLYYRAVLAAKLDQGKVAWVINTCPTQLTTCCIRGDILDLLTGGSSTVSG